RTAEHSHADLCPGSGAAFSVEVYGQERLVMVCEATLRRRPDVADIAECVRRAIADGHDVELHAFVLLRPGSIPKTSSGKIQRHPCRSDFLAARLDALGAWRASGSSSPGSLNRAALLAAPPSRRRGLLVKHFQDQFARVLGMAPSAVDPCEPLS